MIICAKLLYTATSFPTDALFRSDFYSIRFFSLVVLVVLVSDPLKAMSDKASYRRSRKEIRISAQVCFRAINGLCLAEFEHRLGTNEPKYTL